MRIRRVLACVVVLLAAGASAAFATKTTTREFTCPVDGEKFTGRTLVSTNSFGGVDSDMCSWARGESPLPYGVQVCPTCFYARLSGDFDKALAPTSIVKLKKSLAKWREKHPRVKTVKDLASAQRWELAAICAVVRHNHSPIVGRLWLRAAWAKRHEGLATLNMALGDPMSSFEDLDGMVIDLKEQKDRKKLITGKFTLAMLAQRVGEVKRRDACIKQLEKEKLGEVQAARLAALKTAVAEEARYQTLAVDAFKKALADETAKGEDVYVLLYLAADTSRRLGKNAEAVKLYKQVLTAGKVRADVRRMSEFMINWLTPD